MRRTWGSVTCRAGVSLMRGQESYWRRCSLSCSGDLCKMEILRQWGDHHRQRQMWKGVGLNLIWDELCVLGKTEAKKGSCPSPLEPTRTWDQDVRHWATRFLELHCWTLVFLNCDCFLIFFPFLFFFFQTEFLCIALAHSVDQASLDSSAFVSQVLGLMAYATIT